MSTHDNFRVCNRAGSRSGLALAILLNLTWTGILAAPEGPRLGKPATDLEIAGQNISVFPNGDGLPPGKGTPDAGKLIYEGHCAACHGIRGSGGSAGELAGNSKLNGAHPDQTIGNYWPYATTVFDFIRRSMPLNAPRSLSDDQVYAVTAYLLHINGIIKEGTELNPQTLPAISMPNKEGFIRVWQKE